MHNATFIPHTSTSQQPSLSRAPGSYYHSIAKTGLKRLSSSESLNSIGNKFSNKTSGVGTGTSPGTSTNPRTGAGTRPTIISTTTTATTTTAKTNTKITASSSSVSQRAPLRRRDQNAASVTKPLPKEPGIGNMPFETSSPPTNPQPNTNRPQMPSLSAAAARAINRNPLTPKIASKTTQQPPGLVIATTPANRRQQQPAITSANRPDESSPFPSHLNSNVTPRSGSRQNRVDSASSTPNTTPNPERTESWESRPSFGLPSPRFEGEAMRRPVVSFSSIPPEGSGSGRQDGSRTSESKFFHASDVKTVRPTSSSKTAQTKGPTFFYANGNTIENKSSQPTAFTPVLGHSQDSLPSKFMYANGTPELRHSPTPPVSRNSGSSSSTIPKAPSSRPATNPPTTSNSRPLSPAKFPSPIPQISSKTNNIPGSGRPQVLSAPQLGPSPPGLRRSSTGTSRPGGHSRQGSLAKIDQCINTPKLVNLQLSPEASPPITVPSTPAPLTLASIIQAAEDFAEEEEGTGTVSPEEARSGLQSPTKSVHSVEPVNELVANARRERKVQDLQITNASLEAINRTLERQLRKQTAELRRYRRLSRSGRLSMASTAISSRVSDTFSEQGIGIMDLSDLSEMSEAEIEEEAEDDSYFDSDSASESLSPSVMAERDAKHRKRDEERLQLDLSKHQQLLIDSQKINQSIKRCLDWTEVLISEGKKALEYHVRVSDVEVGGRVLDPLDLEEEEEERPQTADSFPEETITLDEKILDSSPTLAGWGFEPQDRDSGIELPADGG
ncbi:hypothetical protein F5Y04DRAFT_264131 [Hypomontagnella monticulosa]|nr:hypothetical protein F5Y04DRAFT_264131 [Hypomontagnella monticulosa]